MPRARAAAEAPHGSPDGVARGGFLCDAMGLGKTLTVCALIAAHPHSPQPFASTSDDAGGGGGGGADASPHAPPFGGALDASAGTQQLSRLVLASPPAVLRAALARLCVPARAAWAFRAASVVAAAARGGAPDATARGTLVALREAAARGDPLAVLGDASLPLNAVVESRATLVVAPASIVRQWQEELRRWAPVLAVVPYVTPCRRRGRVVRALRAARGF